MQTRVFSIKAVIKIFTCSVLRTSFLWRESSRTLGVGLVWLALGLGSLAEVPSVAVSVVTSAPVVDGVLAEPLWQRPPDLQNFKLLKTGAMATEQTEVWLARNDAWLFMAFKCRDIKAGDIKCQVIGRDDGPNRDDSVELFISPGTAGKTYLHFIFNAAGAQADNRSEGTDHQIPWDAHWRSAAVIDPTQQVWTAEIAVPLFLMSAGAGDGEWRLNVCRHRKATPTEFSAWAPVKQNFHEPENFGRVEGLAGLKPSAIFAPVLEKAAVGALLDFPERCYPVMISARNAGGAAGEVNAVAVDITESGRARSPDQPLHMDPGHQKSTEIKVPVTEFIQRRTQVMLMFKDALGTWSAVKEIKPERSTNPLSVCLDRSYYTAEKLGQVIADINLPPAELAKSKLQVHCSWLPDAWETAARQASDRIPIKLDGLAPSNYSVEVALAGGDGKIIARDTARLVKRMPAAAGNEVKTDRWNRSVLVNGKPFFPVGFYGVQPVNYAMAAGMGMNTLIDWHHNAPSGVKARMEAAHSNRLYLITVPHWSFPGLTGNLLSPEFPDKLRASIKETLPEFLKLCAPQPAALTWYGFDEPGGETLEKLCLELTEAIDAGDGYHPNVPLFCRGFPQEGGWFDSFDIGLLDIYWTPESGPRAVQEALDWFKKAERDTRIWNKPFWVAIVGEMWSMSGRIMLPREQRLNTYLALIYGASGVFYFTWPVRHQQTYDMFRTLAGEIETLAPALLTRTLDQQVVVEGGDADRVIVLLKAHPAGGGLLLAANTRDEPVEVTWRISGMAGKGKVNRLFVNKKYPVHDGAFTDRLEGLDTRAYRIPDLKCSEQDPVKIQLKLVVAEKPAVSVFSNLVVNAGFETDEGWVGVKGGNPAFYDTTSVKEGKRALCIKRTEGMGTILVQSATIQLKPRTRYACGVSMRGEFTSAPPQWGGPDFSVYSSTARKGLYFAQTHAADLTDWFQRSGTFTTGDEPQTAQVFIYGSANKFVGSAWIDEVYLRELPAEPVSRNLLPNSSFEVAALPGYPDSWGSIPWLPVTSENLAGQPKALFAQDDTTAFDGKYSLRVRGMHQISTWGPRFGSGAVKLDPDKTYAFSIYMKADRDDLVVQMMIRGPNPWTMVKVGKEWKRYFVTGKGWKTGQGCSLAVDLRPEGAAGGPLKNGWHAGGEMTEASAAAVWFDAAQFEEGTEPTPYVRDTYGMRHE